MEGLVSMKRILIIEDTDTIREELTKLLTRYGYEVLAPTDFENILEYVKENNSDLILLDINLPYFDGYHICREIRKDSNVPIIIVTSRDSDMDEIMSMNLGADDFITKPYNTQVLLARIASLLRRTYSLSEQHGLHKRFLCKRFNICCFGMFTFNFDILCIKRESTKDGPHTIIQRDIRCSRQKQVAYHSNFCRSIRLYNGNC